MRADKSANGFNYAQINLFAITRNMRVKHFETDKWELRKSTLISRENFSFMGKFPKSNHFAYNCKTVCSSFQIESSYYVTPRIFKVHGIAMDSFFTTFFSSVISVYVKRIYERLHTFE